MQNKIGRNTVEEGWQTTKKESQEDKYLFNFLEAAVALNAVYIFIYLGYRSQQEFMCKYR